MIDQKTTPCEICNSETSAPIEHYPYWAVCSDCDNELWMQSSKPIRSPCIVWLLDDCHKEEEHNNKEEVTND